MNVSWIHNHYIVFYNAHATPKARTKSLMNEKRKSSSIRNINRYYYFKKFEERSIEDPPSALKFQLGDFQKLYQPTLCFHIFEKSINWSIFSSNKYMKIPKLTGLILQVIQTSFAPNKIPIKSPHTINHHFSCYKINSS